MSDYSILDYNRQRDAYIKAGQPIGPSSPGYLQGTANRIQIPTSSGVLGAATSNYSAPTPQPSQPTFDPQAEARAAAERAAQDAYNAENQTLNTQFDYAAANAQNQLGTLGTQKDQSLGQVDLGLTDIRNQVGTSKTNLGTNTQQQINQAGSTARNVQGQNRNVLRALGILNSSAAGQILAKPMNQFDEQRAQLGQFLVQKTTELDQFVNQKVAEASQTKDAIVSNYNNLVNQIQTDLRFNERQRNDAIKSANAALSQHLSDIAQAVQRYQQQAQLQKQQFAVNLAQAMNYQNPQYNQQAFTSLGLVNQGQQTSSPAMTTTMTDEEKRRLGLIK